MILYHGSYVEIIKPDLEHSRKYLDFGKGFYMTPICQHAENWAKRFKTRGKQGIVSIYQLDDNAFMDLSCLNFKSYSENWLDFILSCRNGEDKYIYDIVTGCIADDNVFNIIELYLNQLISKEKALEELKYHEPNKQVCLRTFAALSRLTFQGSQKL